MSRRCSEHFHKLLNVPGDIDHDALDNITQRITKTCLDEIPTMDEMARAIAGLKDGKAPGEDGIPPEVWMHGYETICSADCTVISVTQLCLLLTFAILMESLAPVQVSL